MASLEHLTQAVKDYLDELYRAELLGDRTPWPQQLEEMVGWEPPDATVMEVP